MAISNTRQFELLLWKIWLLQKRRRVLTVFLIVIPPLFSLILLAIRGRVGSTFVSNSTIWSSTPANTALPPNLQLPRRIPPPFNYWQLAYAPNNLQAVPRLVDKAATLLNGAATAMNSAPSAPNNPNNNNPNAPGSQATGVRIGQGKWNVRRLTSPNRHIQKICHTIRVTAPFQLFYFHQFYSALCLKRWENIHSTVSGGTIRKSDDIIVQKNKHEHQQYTAVYSSQSYGILYYKSRH